MATFWGMHVSPAKHSYAWLPRECYYRTDALTDRCWTKWSLCAAMLRRWHNKSGAKFSLYTVHLALLDIYGLENKYHKPAKLTLNKVDFNVISWYKCRGLATRIMYAINTSAFVTNGETNQQTCRQMSLNVPYAFTKELATELWNSQQETTHEGKARLQSKFQTLNTKLTDRRTTSINRPELLCNLSKTEL